MIIMVSLAYIASRFWQTVFTYSTSDLSFWGRNLCENHRPPHVAV